MLPGCWNLVLPSTEQHGRTIGSSPLIWISHSLWVIKIKRSRSFVSASIQLITNIFLAFEERWQTLFLLESIGFFCWWLALWMCAHGKRSGVSCPVPLWSSMMAHCSWVMSKVQESIYVSVKQTAIMVRAAWWMSDFRSTEEKEKAATQEFRASLQWQKEKIKRGNQWPSTVSWKARAWPGVENMALQRVTVFWIIFSSRVPQKRGRKKKKEIVCFPY